MERKSVFINPFVDRGFKILFGQKESKDLLIELLNDLLEGERLSLKISPIWTRKIRKRPSMAEALSLT